MTNTSSTTAAPEILKRLTITDKLLARSFIDACYLLVAGCIDVTDDAVGLYTFDHCLHGGSGLVDKLTD